MWWSLVQPALVPYITHQMYPLYYSIWLLHLRCLLPHNGPGSDLVECSPFSVHNTSELNGMRDIELFSNGGKYWVKCVGHSVNIKLQVFLVVQQQKYVSVIRRLVIRPSFACFDNSLAICKSLNCSNQCHRLVYQKTCHVLSCFCDNACKRSLAICCKSRVSCPVSRLLSQ